jgi:1-aminocyclopropane-1-carboxylate deaminase/D-cysteine desulfhydrase-like pyridoxal-dependent ACC family enzyme
MYRLERFEWMRRPLGLVPTPLEYHDSLSRELGVRLFLKREDQLDHFASGNKIRKLEYLLGHALSVGAEALITAGSSQSNQCKAVACVAQRFGLKCRLIICEDALPAEVNGNLLLDLLMGAQVTWLPAAEWANIEEHLAAACASSEQLGQRPYLLRPGASDWRGTLGYVRGGLELAAQEQSQDLHIDHVVLPTGSGGTQAGLLIGGALANRIWRMTGVCVIGERPYFEQRHALILAEMESESGLPIREEIRRVEIYDGAVAGGYCQFDTGHLDEVFRVARSHGVIFDPTYMMKAFLGLKELLRAGEIRPGATVVLVHTGGLFGLFGQTEMMRQYLRDRMTALHLERAAVPR